MALTQARSPIALLLFPALLVAASEPESMTNGAEAESEDASVVLLQGSIKMSHHAHSSATPPRNGSNEVVARRMALLEGELAVYKSMSDAAINELMYELDINGTDGSARALPVKNKLILAILELLGLGLCGIDRCYMGQTCVGVIKGLTLGGLTVWTLMDYVGVIITCLSMYPSINSLGIRADFTESSITPAFVVVVVVLALKCVIGIRKTCCAPAKLEDQSLT